MDDLMAWLRQQLDEDERDARAVEGNGSWDVPSTGVVQLGGVTDLEGLVPAMRNAAHHMAEHDPMRVLAEVDAKRRILDRCAEAYREQGIYGEDGQEQLAEDVLRLLALPYADRSGHRPEWRP